MKSPKEIGADLANLRGNVPRATAAAAVGVSTSVLKADGFDERAVENTVETLKREFNAERQRKQNESVDQIMSRSGFGGWLSRWGMTLASVPANLLSGVGMLAPVATALHSSDYSTVDPNSAWFGPANAVNSIRETHQKYNAGGELNDMLYGIITSSMDSVLGSMVGSGITSGLGLTGKAAAWVGGSVIGAEAAAQSMQDIAARGGSVDQVLTGGLMAGAFETIFEQFSLSQLQGLEQMDLGQAVLEAIGSGSGSLKTALREVTAKNVVKGMITNGSEELFTELANVLYDRFAMGDISNYGQMVRDYMSMGMTEEEARKKAAQQLANQVLEAGYTGALQGLLMDSVALAGNDTRRMSRFAGKYDSAVLLERAAQEAAAGKRMTNREAETILQDAGALRILTEVTGLDISENMSKSQQREAVRNAVEQLASSGMEAETEQTQNPAPAQEAAERPAARDTATEQRATEEYMGAQKTDTTHPVLTETSPTSTAETADAHMSVNDSIQQMPAGVNGVEQIRQAAERSMGKAGAAQAVAFYNGDVTADKYFGSFAAYYQAGVNGSGMDSVRPAYKGVLNQAQEQAAYLAGQADAENNHLAKQAEPDYNTTNKNAEMKGANYGSEEVYLRDGGQWAGSEDPGGAISAVEKGTRRNQNRKAQAVAADEGTASLSYGKRVSTASLGIGDGATEKNIRLVTGGETEATRKAKTLARERGLRLTLFSGDNLRIQQMDGSWASVRAYVSGDRVFVRVDHPRYTADQLMRHEAGHDMIAKGEVDPDTVRERINERFTKERADTMVQLYADAYEGSGYTAEEIWEEVICDSLGDMNIFAETMSEAAAGELLTETKKETAQSGTGVVRGPLSAEGKTSRESNADSEYSGKQVEWAVNTGVITEQDRVSFFHMIANINKLGDKVRRTIDGSYIVDLGNKLLFTDANWHNPSLSSVVVFDDTSETSMRIAKDVIFNGKTGKTGYEQSRQIIEDAYWPGYVKRYTERNSASYARQDAGTERENRGRDYEGTRDRVTDLTAATQEDGEKFSRDLESIDQLREQAKNLRRQNEALRERVEYWKGQTRRTDRAAVDPQAVRRTARELARAYGARLSADEQAKVTGELQGLYDYITRGEDGGNELTYTEVRRRAGEIADTLVNSAVALDDTLYKQYADLRDYARKTQIILSEADARSITDFGSWRKGQMGRMNLKTGERGNVDTVYQEMAQTWPGLFPDGSYMHPADQLLQIAEVLDGIYTVTEYNPHSAYLEDAKAGLANEIMERFFEVPQVRKTFADRQAEALAAAKAEGQARLEALRAEKNERIAEIRQKNKENLERVVTRERRMREEQLQRLKDHYSKLHKDQVAHRVDSDDRNRLLAIARRLQNKKLPAASRALLDQYIGNLDTVARSITGRNLRDLRAMRDWYDDRTANDPDFIPDPSVEKALKRLSQRQINDLSAQEVAELTNVLLHIENELQTERKLIDKEDRRDTYFLGEEAIRDVYATRGSKGGFLDKYIVTATLSPVRQLRRLTGYVDSDPLYKLTQDLADGQRRMFDYQMRAERPAAKFAADKVFSKFFSGKDAKGIEISGLTKDGVKTVTISPAMRVSLYLHSLNNQNLRHIKEGGITIPDWELYRKGKIAEAYDRGVTIKMTPTQVRRIAEGMTAKERAFAHMAQRYFNGQSRDEINAVSEKLKGFSIAQVENYFPLDTDKSFTRSDFDSIKFDGSIEGMGFLKERKNAANPIMLRDANDVLQKSIRQHAKYVGLAIPVRNFNKVWGVTASSFNEDGSRSSYESSVQKAIKQQWGETGYSYIEKMMTDLQSGGGQKNAWARTLNKIRSNYAGAVLTLNLSVAMKQAASYPTAAAVLGWKPLARAMADFGKVKLETIEKYTPLQWYRSQGFSTKELGDLKKAGRQMPAVLNWVQGADLLTTRKLWKASEYYVRQNNKQLSVGSDAYYKAVAEIYNRVIEETQPNYTTMQRPQLLRSDDTLLGNLAMFKTQPFQNFNILYDAAANLEAKARQTKNGGEAAALKAARRDFGRAVTSQLAQLAVFAAMTAAWAFFRGKRKKYEDDEGEVTLPSFLGAIGKDMLGGFLSGVPFGSDLWELANSKLFGEKYYGMDAVTVTAISDSVSSLSGLADLVADSFKTMAAGETVNWNSARVKLDGQLDDLSKAAGVPYENVANLFNAAYRQTCVAVLGKYRGEYAALKLTTDPETYSGDYYDLLYKAMQNDPAAYEAIYADMMEDRYMGMSFTEKKIKSAMEQRMKKAQGVESVKDLESRYLSPAQQTNYDAMLQDVQQSSVWGRATEAQRDSAEDLLYELASGSSTGQKLREKIDGGEAYGIDEADYVLYKLALSIVDQPTESGKLGTYTNDEVEAAIGMLPGLSAAGRAYLWEAQGKSEKSNPYK